MLSRLERPAAVACISGSNAGNSISGTVKFYRWRCGVLVAVDISGLPKDSDSGFFALHIHEGADCCRIGYPNTGSHYNPANYPHPNHAGDLPALLAYEGEAYMAVLTKRFRVEDVIGRTVVIHSNSDDFHTQPAGNAGMKIACGVIRKF